MSFFKIMNASLKHHVVRVPASRDYSFNYPALAAALKKYGASDRETSGLLDLLHDVGWGGIEFPPASAAYKDFNSKELKWIINWFRSQKKQEYPDRMAMFHEARFDYHQKKLFGYHSKNQHLSNVRHLKGRKLD